MNDDMMNKYAVEGMCMYILYIIHWNTLSLKINDVSSFLSFLQWGIVLETKVKQELTDHQ